MRAVRVPGSACPVSPWSTSCVVPPPPPPPPSTTVTRAQRRHRPSRRLDPHVLQLRLHHPRRRHRRRRYSSSSSLLLHLSLSRLLRPYDAGDTGSPWHAMRELVMELAS
uniref:Uncharacterized protein n=1 Tax=Oryza barthii TaxID=65489 RepID=A0A0D3HF39_9ORYZ